MKFMLSVPFTLMIITLLLMSLINIAEVNCNETSDASTLPYAAASSTGTNNTFFLSNKPTNLQNEMTNDGSMLDKYSSSFEMNYMNNDPNYVTDTDRLMDCGKREICGNGTRDELLAGQICYCDPENCSIYGDCCWTLIVNQTLPDKINLWHCQKLEVQPSGITYSLMISECSEGSQDEISKQLCSGENISPENYTYLIDIPVYGNKSGEGILYKNIYCARCHNEKNSNIKIWTFQLACDTEFTPAEREEFMSTARYIPGQRMWQSDENSTRCALRIAEFKAGEIEKAIPNIRYCPAPAIIDSCAANEFEVFNEDYLRRAKLCSSYVQYVVDSEFGTTYKNPHCALCSENSETTSLSCRKPFVGIFSILRKPGQSGIVLPGAGLNFLFDFGFGGNKYVGYDMLCNEDEIWDYVRQKCGPIFCRKGFVLKNGVCVKMPNALPGTGGSGGNTGNDDLSSENTNGTDYNSDEHSAGYTDEHPACSKYRIIFHENEYNFLENPNTSIIIKIPNSHHNNEIEPIILTEREYEFVNETTISICAKYLHHAFELTFSTTLTYLSLISVGISVIFLFLHIILYIFLPKLRNPPGRNLFCLTTSLFIFQFLFLTMITHTKFEWLCIAAAITMHYFFLAAFFWMNIMSFDMWRTFSCNSMLRRNRASEGQKFIKYSIFAWITPGLIVLIASIIDFGFPSDYYYNRDHQDTLANIRPLYGDNGLCWITQRMSLFIFFAVPVLFVVTSNIILFSCTAKAILTQQNEASKVFKEKKSPVTNTTSVSSSSASSKASNRDKIRLMLYVNMALIMGIGWVLGFISQFLASDWLRYFFVIVNGLQGTFIFFAFDFKWKIYRMFQERLYDGKVGKAFGLERSASSVVTADQRRGTVSFSSGTKSTNMITSSISDDEKLRRMSVAI